MLKVSFNTLGCKLNQNETEAFSDAFRKEGFIIAPWKLSAGDHVPLLCIINTCTVTSKAEQKARRIIRLCLQKGCLVLVTGCYAQLEKTALEKLGEEKKATGTLFVFPGQGKEKLLDLPHYLSETLTISNNEDISAIKAKLAAAIIKFISNFYHAETQRRKGRSVITEMRKNLCGLAPLREEKREIISRNPFSFNPQQFTFHSRAFLKIQDGCDFSCAYCRVPLARGKSVSLNSQEALNRLMALEEAGMAEAVLTGVNICQYADPDNKCNGLSGLLHYLLDNTQRITLRLSSIEPNTKEPNTNSNNRNDGDFYRMLAHPRIRNHFHLSVQSGSDSVLAAMGRSYKAQDIINMAEKLKNLRNDPFLACDIITGFPGETEDDFEKTAALCRTVGFAWIHVFPYSKRPGTRAAAIKTGLVSEKTAGERLQVLTEMAKNGKKDYIRRWQGKIVDAVAELASYQDGGANDFSPFFPGLTDNYIKVRCVPRQTASVDNSCKGLVPGGAFRCKILKVAPAAYKKQSGEGGFDAWAELL